MTKVWFGVWFGAQVANGVEYFGLTGDDSVDSLTTGYRWVLDSQKTLRYSISNGFNGEYFLNPDQLLLHFGSAIQTFSQFANVRFQNVGQFANPSLAYRGGSDINLSIDGVGALFNSPDAWAMAFFPAQQYLRSPYVGAAGDVFINTLSDANRLPTYVPGSQGYFLLLHELGHSFGLKHPHDDGGTGRPTFEELGIGRLDQDYVSVMSYNDDASWNLVQWDPATPMVFDVIAMQYLYGKNESTNSGDTFFRVDRTGMYHSVWDASGTDTVSVAAGAEGWLIELPSLTISGLVDTKIGRVEPIADLGLTVPRDLVWLLGDIENALGSNHNDRIVGNEFDNWLQPQGGDDHVDGAGGRDMVLYELRSSQVSLSKSRDQGGEDFYTLVTPVGTDTLYNVELLSFSNERWALDALQEPAGQALRLYQAAFGRDPDARGLGYWISQLENGLPLEDAAYWFMHSNEFEGRYGVDSNTDTFVHLLYENVLMRAPEQSGYDYWFDVLDTGKASRQAVLAYFSESPENMLNTSGDFQLGVAYVPWVA